MEQFSFHYAKYMQEVSRIHYFAKFKNRLILGTVLIYVLICLVLLFYVQSYVFGLTAVAILFVLGLEIMKRTRWLPGKQMKDPRFDRDYHVSFNRNEITLSSDDLSAKVPFKQFIKVWENGQYYFLFHNNKQFWYLPKKAFQSPEQEKTFREYVSKHQTIRSGLIR